MTRSARRGHRKPKKEVRNNSPDVQHYETNAPIICAPWLIGPVPRVSELPRHDSVVPSVRKGGHLKFVNGPFPDIASIHLPPRHATPSPVYSKQMWPTHRKHFIFIIREHREIREGWKRESFTQIAPQSTGTAEWADGGWVVDCGGGMGL
ncbi:hypothetical protein J6590_026987 [Homalodisca vitripennis]|nr:hypothetical protein J6590_026987 [Homalodisca vitripennis]